MSSGCCTIPMMPRIPQIDGSSLNAAGGNHLLELETPTGFFELESGAGFIELESGP